MREKLIGDRRFYRRLLGIAVPMMVQMAITNFAGLLDNLMVGQTGTEQMTGVSIANQLIYVYNLFIFGAVSGPGIFTAQFFGQKNQKGIQYTVRYKMYSCLFITLAGLLVLGIFGKPLIRLYLAEGTNASSAAHTLEYGMQYLDLLLVSFVPFMLVQVYAGTLKEVGQTMLPMKAGLAAVLVNTVLNYVLIFGKFGVPQMGVRGAAIATVTSRVVEMLIVVVWTHRNSVKNEFVKGLYRSFVIPVQLVKEMTVKSIPLVVNEGLWAAGLAFLMQCYSVRGIEVVAGMQISNTLNNLFNIVFWALGSSVAIIVGQLLGAGKLKEAKYSAYKIIFCSTISCLVVGTLMAGAAFVFPNFYETSEEIRGLATQFLLVLALYMPVNSFMHATYFTLRSGGKTFITFLFDSCFVWCVTVPIAFALSRFTQIPIVPLYVLCCGVDVLKCIVGYVLLVKGVWINQLVGKENIS